MSDYWKKEWESIASADNDFAMLGRNGFRFSDLTIYLGEINAALKVCPEDSILDLGCSNGMICAFMSPFCKRITGFDYSENLIKVAKRYYRDIKNISFECRALADADLSGFNKLIIGAVFQYIDKETAKDFMRKLNGSDIEKAYIGHVPDIALKDSYIKGYENFITDKDELKKKQEIWEKRMTWFDERDFDILSDRYRIEFKNPDKKLVQHKYAFDICLERK
ncbi:class I SAM-dependent methyltransferase [Maridesulfovibrio sp.]|uniref:class I SAM-dependent methyltransferase n=1 Tax=Maridesulfovibrio sp. TaxID=2795000 RepID=UPI002A189970|nr:class I SAM-dependent methyltransferase [Maridesulfovibrio sp.]